MNSDTHTIRTIESIIQTGRILIVTAVEAERAAWLRGCIDASQEDGAASASAASSSAGASGLPSVPAFVDRINVIAGGVGVAAVSASTTRALTLDHYDLIMSVGIAGGFVGQAELGSLVLANRIIAADLGVETTDGFQCVDELGFGSWEAQVDQAMVVQVKQMLQADRLQVNTGAILTLNTVTGTQEKADELTRRVPGAVAEAMEGYGVAIAAQQAGVPVIELRAISNAVGPRDRASWKMKEAMEALTKASRAFSRVIAYSDSDM